MSASHRTHLTQMLCLRFATVLLWLATSNLGAAELIIPDNIAFERDVEFSNVDGQHLRLNIARPKAATVTYRLSPAYQFPAAVQDCKTAVRWLRANATRYHVDPKRIGTMGASAGGHLALFLGVTAGIPEFEGEEATRADQEMMKFFDAHLKTTAATKP